MQELRLQAMLNVQSTGYAMGNIKKHDFLNFLDGLQTKPQKINVGKTMQKLKEFGIPIEEK